jgi:hypothetical protein
MELPREWQPERAVPPEALMDWVEDEAAHLEVERARVEVQPPVALLEQVLVRPPAAARAEAQPLVALPEAARAEAQPLGPTYRVIQKYPPRIEAWEHPLVGLAPEARQQLWARRTRPV